MSASSLAGRCILITGAGSGIGLATARLARERGAAVAGLVQDDAQCLALAAAAPQAHIALGDVTDAAGMEVFVARAREALGCLDGAACCAGVFDHRAGLETTAADWDRVLAINLTGTFSVARAVAGHLARQRRGSLVTVSSQIGLIGHPRAAAYAASKAGINGLTKALALELAPSGVRVNAVAPGVIATPMTEAARGDPGRRAGLLAGIPLGRFGEAEEVAEAIVFLLSDAAAFITGQVLCVDGGWTAQ